jgi:integrase
MPEGLRIHDMRHTAASLLVSAGANVKVCSNTSDTRQRPRPLDRYAHLFTEDLEAVAERLDPVWVTGNEKSKAGMRIVELKK